MADSACNAFRRNPDGSWTCLRPVTIKGPHGEVSIGPGASFQPGTQMMGLDVGAWLNANCGRLG